MDKEISGDESREEKWLYLGYPPSAEASIDLTLSIVVMTESCIKPEAVDN
jgi:hypothetical protein